MVTKKCLPIEAKLQAEEQEADAERQLLVFDLVLDILFIRRRT
jgi:hypothetical protein